MYLHCAENDRHPKRIASHMTIVAYGKLPPPLLPFMLLLVSMPFLAFSIVSLALCLREDRLEVSNGLATQLSI